ESCAATRSGAGQITRTFRVDTACSIRLRFSSINSRIGGGVDNDVRGDLMNAVTYRIPVANIQVLVRTGDNHSVMRSPQQQRLTDLPARTCDQYPHGNSSAA